MAPNEQALTLQPELQTTTATEPAINFPSGDITVLMQNPNDTNTPIKATVSPVAFSIASPVWKKFLYPPWSSDPSTTILEMNYSSDDPEALVLLLNIAHTCFRLVPKRRLSYSLPLQMAILVH